MNELALFAGAGGGVLGGKLLGWRTVCAVEWEPYAAGVLIARQNDGVLPPFPIWDDVRTFDGKPWRGRVDVVSGGFPCQDISSAGKGAGIDGARSGMWAHMARIVHEVGPRFVFVENSPMLTSRGLGRVLGDLAAMGYDAQWGVLGAVDAGAPHKRDRIWIVGTLANADRVRKLQSEGHESNERGRTGNSSETLADTLRDGSQGQREDGDAAGSVGLCNRTGSNQIEHLRHTASEGLSLGVNGSVGQPRAVTESERSDWWATEPDLGRVAHGVAARVDRLKAIGNGQVSAVAAIAWQTLTKEL